MHKLVEHHSLGLAAVAVFGSHRTSVSCHRRCWGFRVHLSYTMVRRHNRGWVVPVAFGIVPIHSLSHFQHHGNPRNHFCCQTNCVDLRDSRKKVGRFDSSVALDFDRILLRSGRNRCCVHPNCEYCLFGRTFLGVFRSVYHLRFPCEADYRGSLCLQFLDGPCRSRDDLPCILFYHGPLGH